MKIATLSRFLDILPLRALYQGMRRYLTPFTLQCGYISTDINISRKQEAGIQKKKIFQIALLRENRYFTVYETYFALKGPIPGNVTGSNPIPVAVWLHIYLIDVNIFRN